MNAKALFDLLRELAALKRYDPQSRKGSESVSPNRVNLTLNVPKDLLARIDAALADATQEPK